MNVDIIPGIVRNSYDALASLNLLYNESEKRNKNVLKAY